MEISVREAAQWLGVSERRVQALAAAGRLHARRLGRAWMIDAARLRRAQARSRAMSPRIAQAMIALLSDPHASSSDLGVAPREASRLRARLSALRADSDPASLLASWLAAADPAPALYSAHPSDLAALLADRRLVASGISDPRSDLAVSDEIQAWIHADDLDALVAEHMLAPGGDANVRLHVSDAPIPNPVPIGRLLADLAVHPGPREGEAVQRLLNRALPQPA